MGGDNSKADDGELERQYRVPTIKIDQEKDSAQVMIKSFEQCRDIVRDLNFIGTNQNGKMYTSKGYITVLVGQRDRESLTCQSIFSNLVQNQKALLTVIELGLAQWKGVLSLEATKPTKHASKSAQSKTQPAPVTIDTLFDKVSGIAKENQTLKRKLENDTRHLLVEEMLATLKTPKPQSQEEVLKQLQKHNAELIDRLAAEMNAKVSENESSLENISIPNRPMTVAEEYGVLNSNAWLAAKTALDERYPDSSQEANKVQALCKILMEAEEQAKSLHKTVHQTLASQLKHPMSRYGTPGQSPDPQNSGSLQRMPHGATAKHPDGGHAIDIGSDLLPSYVLTAVGDYFRNTADYVKLDVLYEKIKQGIKEKDESGTGTITKLLEEEGAVNDYMKQYARLAWKMVIQRPPMRFDTTRIGEPWTGQNNLDIAWNSDPHRQMAIIRYYKYPTLFHGDHQMVRGSVFVN